MDILNFLNVLKPCVTPSRVLARFKKWHSQVRVCEKMAKYASIGPLIDRKMLKISHFLSFQKKWEKQRQKIKIRFLNIFRPKKGMRERSFFVWKIAKNQPWEHSTSKNKSKFRILSILETKVTRAACQFWNV